MDRVGCLDTDGDGWSDPDSSWNASMGADAFPDNETEHRDLDGDGIGDVADPDMDGDGVGDEVDVWPEDPVIWSDGDGDGYADQSLHKLSDNCPHIYGKSRIRLKGCSDLDGDFMPASAMKWKGQHHQAQFSTIPITLNLPHWIPTKIPFPMSWTTTTITTVGLMMWNLTEVQIFLMRMKLLSRSILASILVSSMPAV